MEIPNNVNNAEYGVNQIKTLEGIEAIRLRAGMYIGSVGPAGVRHITLEIISNDAGKHFDPILAPLFVEVMRSIWL